MEINPHTVIEAKAVTKVGAMMGNMARAKEEKFTLRTPRSSQVVRTANSAKSRCD